MQQVKIKSKLQNLISFGKQSMEELRSHSSIKDQPYFGAQDSSSFQFSKQINKLGIDIIRLSQRKLSESIDLNVEQKATSGRIRQLVQFIKQNLAKVKQEMMNIKLQHKAYQQLLQQSPKIPKHFHNLSINNAVQFHCSKQALSQLKPTALPRSKPVGVKLKLCRQYKIDIKSECNQQSYKYKFAQIKKQLQNLKQDNELKIRQIQILKTQIIMMDSLSKKRQAYCNQRLRVKQLEWQRKINQILQQINFESKSRCNTETVEAKNWFDSIQSNKSDQSWKYKDCKTQISQDENYQPLTLNLKNSIQSRYTTERNHFEDKSSNQYKSRTSRSKYEQNNPPTGLNPYEPKIQKLRFTRQRERKQSTEYSFERVNNKIKKLQDSVKNQISRIYA